MKSRRLRQELLAELPRWEGNRWLTPEGARALSAEYSLDQKGPALAPLISAVLAAALVLGGLILLLAHNWDGLPRLLRVGLALLPTAVVAGLGAWRLKAGSRPGGAAAESLALASSLSVALAISLIAQVYHISGDFPSFVLTWGLLSLPAAFLMESSLTWILFQVLACLWYCNYQGEAGLPGYAALVLASVVPLQLKGFVAKPGLSEERPFSTFFLGACLSVALARANQGAHGYAWPLITFGAWSSALFLHFTGPEAGVARLLRVLSAIGLSIVLMILSFEDAWRHLDFGTGYGHPGIPAWNAIAVANLCIVLLALALVLRWRQLDPTEWAWGLAGLVPGACALLATAGLESWTGMLLVNLLILALSLLTLWRGLRDAQVLRTNLGWLLLCTLILVRFFDTHFSYLARGLVFIALGLGFLGVNLWLRRSNSPKA
jgi:uncharacterized membrane protein